MELGAAKDKINLFVNDYLLTNDLTAQIVDVSEEKILYRFNIKISDGRDVVTFSNKKVTKYFPQIMDINTNGENPKEKISNFVNENLVSNNSSITEIDANSNHPPFQNICPQ